VRLRKNLVGKFYRYQPSFSLPKTRYLPGIGTHPEKPGGNRFGLPPLHSEALNRLEPGACEYLRIALDLYQAEYFWESHLYLEALWNAESRLGPVADFLKMWVKLAAAGVKFAKHEPVQARVHLKRAVELTKLLKHAEGALFLGFSLENIQEQITDALERDGPVPKVLPDWK
jgi:hypothetical protein